MVTVLQFNKSIVEMHPHSTECSVAATSRIHRQWSTQGIVASCVCLLIHAVGGRIISLEQTRHSDNLGGCIIRIDWNSPPNHSHQDGL